MGNRFHPIAVAVIFLYDESHVNEPILIIQTQKIVVDAANVPILTEMYGLYLNTSP